MIDSSTAPAPAAAGTDVHVPDRTPQDLSLPAAPPKAAAACTRCAQPFSAHEFGIFCP